MTARGWILAFCLTAGVALPGVATGQELIVRSAQERTTPATQPAEAPLPTMDYSHPELAGDGGWAGLMVGLVLVLFFLAALIGVITDIDKSYASPGPDPAKPRSHAPHA